MWRQPYPSASSTYAANADHLNRGKVKAYEAMGVHLVLGEREGARFSDAFTGRRYWNCHCNGGVFNLGHRNPRVIAAVREGLDHLDIGNHHLLSGLRAQLAAKLAASTGDLLPGVVFGVSGGEANDLALKLARSRNGRYTIVSAHGGYHGHTGLSVAAGDPAYREPFGPNLPGFVQVPFNDLDALAEQVDAQTAAVILEPIPATLGMVLPAPGYLAGVQQICRDAGALLILDEVQTGLGRTGSFWYFQQEGLQPDVVTTGKGLSGGIYPITATLMSAELQGFFDDHPFVHLSTYGGAELGCLAASAVVDTVNEPGFLDRVDALGDTFERGLQHLPFELRRRGMFMAFKFPNEGDGLRASAELLQAGVFTVWAGNDTSVLQFLPPLILDDEEAHAITTLVRQALG